MPKKKKKGKTPRETPQRRSTRTRMSSTMLKYPSEDADDNKEDIIIHKKKEVVVEEVVKPKTLDIEIHEALLNEEVNSSPQLNEDEYISETSVEGVTLVLNTYYEILKSSEWSSGRCVDLIVDDMISHDAILNENNGNNHVKDEDVNVFNDNNSNNISNNNNNNNHGDDTDPDVIKINTAVTLENHKEYRMKPPSMCENCVELEEEIKDLLVRLERKKVTVDLHQVCQECSTLKRELEFAVNSWRTLEEELNDVKKQKEQMKKEGEKHEDEKIIMNKIIENLEETIKGMELCTEKEVKEKSKTIVQLLEYDQEKKQIIMDLEKQLKDVRKEVDDKEHVINELKAEVEERTESLSKVSNEKEVTDGECRILKEKATERER